LPGVIGCIQATETLKILLGRGDTLSGRLLLYDAMAMTFQELKLRKDPKLAPITELIDYQQFCGMPANDHDQNQAMEDEPFQRIDVLAARDRLNTGWKPYVLDVRRESEAEIVRLDWADRLQPHGEVAAISHELPRDRDILVHCKMGSRSAKACVALAELGFSPERLFNLDGGIVGWAKQVDPTLPTY
jgi:adenylyltransferase/sulfurtransferase